jgi:hypothetical protein
VPACDSASRCGGSPSGGRRSPRCASARGSDACRGGSGALTLVHGLGVQPSDIQVYLRCITAEQNYSIGDEVRFNDTQNNTGGSGMAVIPDATNINARFHSANTPALTNKTTRASGGYLTAANWKAVFRCQVFN